MHVQTKGILLGGLLLGLFSFQMVAVQQENRWANEFNGRVEKASLMLGTRIEALRQGLLATQALFHSDPGVSRHEFQAFTQHFLKPFPFIKSVKWVPRVPAGHPGTAELFPALYVEPPSGNESAVGVDLGRDSGRLAELKIAADLGQPRVYYSFKGKGNPESGALVEVLFPVYQWGNTPLLIPERREHLKGFVVGVFHLKDLVRSSLKPYSLDEGSLAVFQKVLNGKFHFLYGEVGPDRISLHRVGTTFFNHTWEMVWQESRNGNRMQYSSLPFKVGAGVFLAFILLALMFETNLDRIQVQTLIENSVDGIITIDTRSVIKSFNPAAEKMFGYKQSEMLNRKVTVLMPEEFVQGHEKGLARYLATGKKKILGTLVEVTARRKDGEEFPVELGISELKTVGKHLFTAIIRDISAHKKLEKELEALSHTDSLTGINNRRFFDQQLEIEWKRSTRDTNPLSLVIVDIDNFKIYNDTYGHVVGDDCLKAVAKALNNCLHRAGDFIARYGGEEFVVLLPGIDQEHALVLAETMRRAVELLSIENLGSPVSQFVTISVGLATIQNTKGRESNELVTAADNQLYKAKQNGKNRTETTQL